MIGTFSETNEAIRCLSNPHAWPCRCPETLKRALGRRLSYLRHRIAEAQAMLPHMPLHARGFYLDWLRSDRIEAARIEAAISEGA